MGWMAVARRRVAEEHSERPRWWAFFERTASDMVVTMVSMGTVPSTRWLGGKSGGLVSVEWDMRGGEV